MPAIYIQLAGERTHFTLFPLLGLFKVDSRFSSAQLAQATRGCHCVARATCHNCGHVCFDLQRTLRANAPKCQGWPRCCGAAGDVAARRAHDAALNCRIVCVSLSLSAGREIA